MDNTKGLTTLTEEAVRAAMEGTKGVSKGPWDVHERNVKNEGRCVARMDWLNRDEIDDLNAAHIARCSPEFIRALCEDWLRQREALEKVDRIAKVPFGTFNHISQVASAALSPLPEEKKP